MFGPQKLRYECENLINWFGGASTAASVGSRNDSFLSKRRDGKECDFDAVIPEALLAEGRAAARYLPRLKAELAKEEVDGVQQFVEG